MEILKDKKSSRGSSVVAPQMRVCHTTVQIERTDATVSSCQVKAWLATLHKRQSILINNWSVKARTPGCSTLCAQRLQQTSQLLFLLVSGNMRQIFDV